jgi:hypothetical protein
MKRILRCDGSRVGSSQYSLIRKKNIFAYFEPNSQWPFQKCELQVRVGNIKLAIFARIRKELIYAYFEPYFKY